MAGPSANRMVNVVIARDARAEKAQKSKNGQKAQKAQKARAPITAQPEEEEEQETHVIQVELHKSWTSEKVAKVFENICNKRKSWEAPSDDSLNGRRVRKPKKLRGCTLKPDDQVKLDKIIAEFRIHYARYFSVTEEEIQTLIHKHFEGLSVNDDIYKTVRGKIMVFNRSWQNRWITNFKAHWKSLLEVNHAMSFIHNIDDISKELNRIYKPDALNHIMDFARNLIDFNEIAHPNADNVRLFELYSNIYAWFGAFVRRDLLKIPDEGRDVTVPGNMFRRIRLVARAEEFDDITPDMIPTTTPKPETARRVKKPKLKSIKEAHPGFSIHKRTI